MKKPRAVSPKLELLFKCTEAKLIPSIILPVTLGYTTDEFAFGVFRCSILEKALVESLKTVDFWRLVITVISKGKCPHYIKTPTFDIRGCINSMLGWWVPA